MGLPGAPFYLFVDRFAGCDCVALPNGSYTMVEREKQGFHYSAIPTAEYRARFGFLSYSCAHGNAVFLVNQGAMPIPRDKVVAIPGEDGQPRCLPRAILDSGRVDLTAIIHPYCPAYDFWDNWGVRDQRGVTWPKETGGRTTLKRIFERCQEMRKRGYREARLARMAKAEKRAESCSTDKEKWDAHERAWADPILYELMEPERLRQEAQMLNAIDRVCMFIGSETRNH
jgi:hypothetical protein